MAVMDVASVSSVRVRGLGSSALGWIVRKKEEEARDGSVASSDWLKNNRLRWASTCGARRCSEASARRGRVWHTQK